MDPLLYRLADSIPQELWAYLLRFLSGYDLLPVSHVNTRFYTELFGPSSAAWTTRVPHVVMREGPSRWRDLARTGWMGRNPYAGCYAFPMTNEHKRRRLEHQAEVERKRVARKAQLESSAKRQYFARVSLRFPGLFQDGSRYGRHRGAGIVAPREFSIQYMWAKASFSFDVWFALLPEAATPIETAARSAVGGVLLGAQSHHGCQRQLPAAMAQYAHVDCNKTMLALERKFQNALFGPCRSRPPRSSVGIPSCCSEGYAITSRFVCCPKQAF